MNKTSDESGEFILPPKMYHGTTTQYLDQILEFGLLPRSASGIDTTERYNEQSMASAPGLVYLSETSALAYSMFWCNLPYQPVVIEVDTQRLSLANIYPDEDNLIVHLACLKRGTKLQIHSVTEQERAELQIQAKQELLAHQDLRTHSLKLYKRVAHLGAIDRCAISRFATINLTSTEQDNLFKLLEFAQEGSVSERFTLGLRSRESYMMPKLNNWLFGADLTPSYLESPMHKLPKALKDKTKALLRKRTVVTSL